MIARRWTHSKWWRIVWSSGNQIQSIMSNQFSKGLLFDWNRIGFRCLTHLLISGRIHKSGRLIHPYLRLFFFSFEQIYEREREKRRRSHSPQSSMRYTVTTWRMIEGKIERKRKRIEARKFSLMQSKWTNVKEKKNLSLILHLLCICRKQESVILYRLTINLLVRLCSSKQPTVAFNAYIYIYIHIYVSMAMLIEKCII